MLVGLLVFSEQILGAFRGEEGDLSIYMHESPTICPYCGVNFRFYRTFAAPLSRKFKSKLWMLLARV